LTGAPTVRRRTTWRVDTPPLWGESGQRTPRRGAGGQYTPAARRAVRARRSRGGPSAHATCGDRGVAGRAASTRRSRGRRPAHATLRGKRPAHVAVWRAVSAPCRVAGGQRTPRGDRRDRGRQRTQLDSACVGRPPRGCERTPRCSGRPCETISGHSCEKASGHPCESASCSALLPPAPKHSHTLQPASMIDGQRALAPELSP
jgi:hypothetical protein